MMEIEKMKREGNTEGLIELLLKGDVYRKMHAADALGSMGADAVPALIKSLDNVDPNIRWSVAIALGRIGDPALESLIETLGSDKSHAKPPATWALAEIGDERAVDPLIRVLEDDTSECCQVMAAAALLKIHNPKGITKAQEICAKKGNDFAGYVREAYFGS